jgi:hypothetical protein
MTDGVLDALAEWRAAIQTLRALDPRDPGYGDAEQALIDAAARFGHEKDSNGPEDDERDQPGAAR